MGSRSASLEAGGRFSSTTPGYKAGVLDKLDAWAKRKNLRVLRTILRVQKRYGELNGNFMASAVTLSSFVSIFPLLLFAAAVLGFFAAGSPDLAGSVIDELGLTGDAATAVVDTIAAAERSRRTASVVGVVGLLWSGLGLVAALQYAINTSWQVTGHGWKDKLKGLLWLGGASLLFLASFAVSAALNFLPAWMSPLNILVGLALNLALWLWTLKQLSNRDVGWQSLLPGAVVGAVGFEVLKLVGSVYVPRLVASSSALYGSLGVVFAILAWLLFFGRLIVYSSVVNVVRWEEDHGTVTVDLPVPRVPGEVPTEATRSGEVDIKKAPADEAAADGAAADGSSALRARSGPARSTAPPDARTVAWVTAAPFGSWASPITAARLVEKAVSVGQVTVDGADVYWNEGRPSEGGRQVVMRWTPGGGEAVEVLPAGFSARTTVHEYGGASYTVRDGVVWFANFDDQRIYRVETDAGRGFAPPRPVTAEPPSARSVRYADFQVSQDGSRLAAVRERHLESGEVVNDLVLLDAAGPAGDATVEPEVVAAGHDFYASPRFAPDDGPLAWLTWDHPDMPWDATTLWIDGERVAGGPGESISQPRWAPDGSLLWASDRTGFWNLYRDGRIVVEEEAEYSGPDWVFGLSSYAVLPSGALVAARSKDGRAELTVDGAVVEMPFTSFSSLHAYGDGAVVAVVASAREAPAVVRITIEGDDPGQIEVIRRSRPAAFDGGYLSAPEPVTFATDAGPEGDRVAHALYYPPTNPDFEGPPGELPPLVVMSHGGPTSAARSELNLTIQYFTSRGLAVVDVDYGGSSGYGRAYRGRLDGQWGIVDVADCVNAARHLAGAGLVDGARMVIRGGSAGGFTTLCALTFSSGVFAAGASFYGVADLASLATDTHKFESRYLDRLVGPWPEAADVYRARSPIHSADRLSAPVIIFQGMDDKVVPPAQAEILVDALRAKGLPFAYVTFEGEQHGFRKAETIVRAAEAELWFYGRILGFQPADDIEPVPLSNW